MKKKRTTILYCLVLIVLIFPRSFDVLFPKIYEFINILKIISIMFLAFVLLKKKIRISTVSKWLILYFSFLFFVTIFNKISLMDYLKTYSLNFGMILFCELVFNNDERDKLIMNFSHIFLMMLIINFGFILICKSMYNVYTFGNSLMFFLGQDNRFILYIIPPILFYNYGFSILKQKNSIYLLFLTYIISIISLWTVWSAAALVVIIGLIFINLFLLKFKKIKINLQFISLIIFVLNISIVFFHLQNLFSFFIVDILHKSLDLSYRTYIWDKAIEIFKSDTIRLIFGHGFQNVENIFFETVIKSNGQLIYLRPNHLHNIIINCLFFGGVIGSLIYINIYIKIIKKINIIKQNLYFKNILAFILISIQVLLIFDTFEFYQLYYFILIFIYYLGSNLIKNEFKTEFEKKFTEFKKNDINDRVTIMMATYNGEKYLSEQIKSIINQSYKNWVLYINDDNSSDNTIKIINKYKALYQEKIILLKNDSGLNGAKFNFANLYNKVEESDYYMFCDQDDVWDKDKIYKLLYFIKEKEKFNSDSSILVYCDSYVTDQKLNIIEKSLIHGTKRELPVKNVLNHFLVQNYFPGCTVMFNNKLKNKTGKIYELCEMHDWWLSQVAAYCGKIYFLDECLHYYRQHENNTIGAQKKYNIVEKIKISFKKLINFRKTYSNWYNFQKTVLLQANELKIRYQKYNYSDSNIVVEKFINIMNCKSDFRKLLLLILYNYTPSDILRVLRLL